MTGYDTARGNALEAIFDALPDPVFVKDRDCRIVFGNRALTELFGTSSSEDLSGKTSAELFRSESAEKVYEDDRQVMTSGCARTYEETVVLANGKMRTYITTKTPYRDAQGRIIGLIGISKDVSKRKLAEDRLKASEERFRGIFEQAPISIQILSPEGKTLGVNAAWKKLWGEDSAFIDFVLTQYNILDDPQLLAKGVTPYLRKAIAGENATNPPVYYDAGQLVKGARGRWVEGYFYPV